MGNYDERNCGRACQLSVRLMGTTVSILEYHRCTRCRCPNAKFHTNSEKEKSSKKLKIDLSFILKRIFRENSLAEIMIPYPLFVFIYFIYFIFIRDCKEHIPFLSSLSFFTVIFLTILSSLLYITQSVLYYLPRKITWKAF